MISTEDNAVATEVKDWESVIQACDVGSQYYHWAYGRMEVVAMEDVYIYLKLLDKKRESAQVGLERTTFWSR